MASSGRGAHLQLLVCPTRSRDFKKEVVTTRDRECERLVFILALICVVKGTITDAICLILLLLLGVTPNNIFSSSVSIRTSIP